MTDFARCRSCGAEIVWTVTDATGKRMPVDAHPVADGNLALYFDELGVKAPVSTAYTLNELAVKAPRYRSHFATCPDATEHRKARHAEGRLAPHSRRRPS